MTTDETSNAPAREVAGLPVLVSIPPARTNRWALAVQWRHNGDHPKDDIEYTYSKDDKEFAVPIPSEGKVVRYFRHPGIPGELKCRMCGYTFHDHGYLDRGLPLHESIVCPGDWIVEVEPMTYAVLGTKNHTQVHALEENYRSNRS